MNFARCEAIARAVLYEGYNLYPYRPSALKNRQRWTFGGVFPRDWAARAPDDRAIVQTQCLLRGGDDTVIELRLRFLHIDAREIGAPTEPAAESEPAYRTVPFIEIDGVPLFAWEEAREREIIAAGLSIERLLRETVYVPFAFPAERTIEEARAADGRIAALIIRTARALRGEITVAAERAGEGVCRITARVENTTTLTDCGEIGRETAQLQALASTHIALGVERGAFVSLIDPPAELAEAASRCDNRGLWPVLAGPEGTADTMLAAPIILYDHPRIAPESPGDLFDGCEIDEILTLRILTLTDAEKREIAAADPRSRAMLERTEALTADEMARLHGTFRDAGGGAPISPAPPPVDHGGAERAGVRWGIPEQSPTPTSPSQRSAPGPSLSPLKGGEGNFGVFGYGKGYIYDPDTEEGFSGQNYFPDGTARRNFYRPGERGFEREVKKRLEYWDKLRQRAAISPSPPPGAERAG
jgi:hypothetical protein